jgi:hypothetical protein
MDPDVLKMLG